jgi:hypothetical protein
MGILTVRGYFFLFLLQLHDLTPDYAPGIEPLQQGLGISGTRRVWFRRRSTPPHRTAPPSSTKLRLFILSILRLPLSFSAFG